MVNDVVFCRLCCLLRPPMNENVSTTERCYEWENVDSRTGVWFDRMSRKVWNRLYRLYLTNLLHLHKSKLVHKCVRNWKSLVFWTVLSEQIDTWHTIAGPIKCINLLLIYHWIHYIVHNLWAHRNLTWLPGQTNAYTEQRFTRAHERKLKMNPFELKWSRERFIVILRTINSRWWVDVCRCESLFWLCVAARTELFISSFVATHIYTKIKFNGSRQSISIIAQYTYDDGAAAVAAAAAAIGVACS